MKVLMIEANKLASEVNTLLLKTINPSVEVIAVASYAQALAHKYSPITAVMSDLYLPDTEPLLLAEKLERNFGHVPVVFMSSMCKSDLDYRIIERRGFKIIDKHAPLKVMRAELMALIPYTPSFAEIV